MGNDEYDRIIEVATGFVNAREYPPEEAFDEVTEEMLPKNLELFCN